MPTAAAVWIGTTGGLDRFRALALNPTPLPEAYDFYALAADNLGSILIGTATDGLNRFEGGKITHLDNVPVDRITSLLRGPDAKLWIGGMPTLGYVENEHFVALPLPKEIASSNGDTQAMAIAPDGSLWLQSLNNGPLMRSN